MPLCAVIFNDGMIGAANVPEDKLGEELITYKHADLDDYDECVFAGIDVAPAMEIKRFMPIKVFKQTVAGRVVHTVFLER